MEMHHLPIYVIVFLCGAFVLYMLQKLIGYINRDENKGYPNTMDTKVIQQMVDDYRNNHLAAINEKLGLNDAHSVSFGLTILKKFISDIEYQTKKRNPRIGINELGVRFYYAAYPKDTEWENFENEKSIGKDYAQKHTLIMIPTLKKKINNGNHQDYDFNPLDKATFSINKRNEKQKVVIMAMNSENSDGKLQKVMAQNHGQTIPPADSAVENY